MRMEATVGDAFDSFDRQFAFVVQLVLRFWVRGREGGRKGRSSDE